MRGRRAPAAATGSGPRGNRARRRRVAPEYDMSVGGLPHAYASDGRRGALPVDRFSWDADRGVFKINTTVADLKQMPEWVEGQQTMTGSSQPPKTPAPSNAGDSQPSSR